MTKKGLFFIFILLAFSVSIFGQDKTVSFATDKEKEGGFLLAITQAAFEKVGYKVTVSYQPWVRALDNVKTGKTDALLGALYSDERAAKMLYSDSIGQSEMVFFKLKETSINYKQLSDLNGFTIGTIAQSVYTPEFDNAANLKKEPAAEYLTNIKKLLAKHIQLFLEKKSVVLNTLKTQFPQDADKIDFLSPPLKLLKFYNCFSKAIPGFEQKAKDFNQGLGLIIKDGTYKKIMDQGLHE